MSWQPPNYPKGWGKPPPHTPSPIPFRQMYTPSPPHITSSKHYPVGSPCMSPTSSSTSSSRLPPPYIPCPKPTRPLAISPLAMPVYLPDQHGGPSQHINPTQNYLYQDNHMPTNVYMEPLSSILHESSYNDQNDGRSTAEIIANQSQDYVDEKLAEYQATIFQLQGTAVVCMWFNT